MKSTNVFKYFIDHPIKMRLLFVFTFILYGILISTISYSVSNHYQTKQTKSKLLKTQEQSFSIKTKHLEEMMDNFTLEIEALKKSKYFKKYIETNSNKEIVDELFSVMISHNKHLSQLRYIDENGLEKIRFDRDAFGERAFKIDDKKLQNKASRYYFKDIKNTPRNTIWYSKLDLNVEHGKIQMPIVPTLRIGTPVYLNNEFKGVLIMNIFFKDIINDFTQSPFFYITIHDKNGEFIHHKHPNVMGVMTDYSWSRYLENNFNLDIHKQNLKRLLENPETKDYILNKTIADIIPNNEGLAVYYEPKMIKLREIEKNERSYILTVTLIVLLISVPLALVISVIPNVLNHELFETKKLLEEEAKVVDEYVYLSITDRNGKILDVSKAYEELTGYTKEELLGNKHNILKHPETAKELYEDLWGTILDKKVWKGELENLKKDGTSFFAKVYIKPNLDEDGEIVSFTAFIQDITYEKKIEKISVTDELTTLYNRREFNKIFERYVSYTKRHATPFSMLILDIDFFKQFNDTYGHPKGDEVLVKVAKEIKKISSRSSDLGFRLGGEEFAFIYSSNTEEDAKAFAEKLRKNIEDLKIEHSGSQVSKYVTASIGLFYSEDLSNQKVEEIYTICDQALYDAKKKGRNRTIVAKV